MNVQQFIKKWHKSTLKERSASQSHFNDLCALLGVPTPTDVDPDGTWYTFERGAKKTGGGDGWADVWKRGCFAWEYKGKHKDLIAAFAQLQRYAIALENPPLLIVSDMDSIVIHTNFTNTVQEIHVIPLDELENPDQLRLLKQAFTEPERLKPGITTLAITEQAASRFADLAQALRGRGNEPQQVAHFLNKLLFCMFAEDVGLLPNQLFTKLLETAVKRPQDFLGMAQDLFRAMQKGGRVGFEAIEWFNGGLFDDDHALPLEETEVKKLLQIARMDWSAIEPSIFGTLFERGLDPDKRSQLGAHYTDPVSIMRIVNPVVIEPLLAEWAEIKPKIHKALEKYNALSGAAKFSKKKSKTLKKPQALIEAENLYQTFLERLKHYRVLDPACGSGNFLYLALQHLKDLELRVMLEAEEMGLHVGFPGVGPASVLGIELNPYAAELARVTVWIGEIQWTLRHGFPPSKNPILKKLDQIQCRDAVLDLLLGTDVTDHDEEGNTIGGGGQAWAAAEPEWPVVDAIIGNPPFLGGSKLLRELGEEYTAALRDLYKGRVPGGADLVTYWFEKARAHIEQGKARYAGLVATQAIRAGSNRKVLERILNTPCPSAGERENLAIFNAWSDEAWINNGAAVRVSLVCFGASGLKSPSTTGGGVGEGVIADTRHNPAIPKPALPEDTKSFARALRKNATDAENLLWQLLRKNQILGYGFRRQHPLGPYFLDFYCHQAKLAVELDGGQHADPKQWVHDEKRSAYLAEQGVTVLRFWNNEMLTNTEGVLQTLYDWLRGFSAVSSAPTPTPPPMGEGLEIMLDGQPVAAIHADLTTGGATGGMDLTQAKRLKENAGVSFEGTKKYGDFDIAGDLARRWLSLPNPNGCSSAGVVKPWANGQDITGRWSDTWIIDFGTSMPEQEAALYETPFAHVLEKVKPYRDTVRRERTRRNWWIHEEARVSLRKAIQTFPRYIVTPRVAKHRLFVFLPACVLPDTRLNVIARADDATFGILHSRIHEIWALANASMHGVGNDPTYNAKSCFETFPFPVGLTPDLPSPPAPLPLAGEGSEGGVAEGIAAAARRLNELRENWLNPPEWVDWVRTPEEEKAGYPARPVAKSGCEAELKKRTLTNLYNARPAWLDNAHKALDSAVALAYGWDDYTPEMADEEILRRLLKLNLERTA